MDLTHDAFGRPIKPRAKRTPVERGSMSAEAYRREVDRATPELTAQKRVVRWLRTVLPPGSIVASYANERGGSGRSPEARRRYGAAVTASGRKAGMPDLSIYLAGCRVVLIEMKRPVGGVLSEDQAKCHAELRAMGFFVGIATSVDEARELLASWGVPVNHSADRMFA
jgi:hypothetical protein